MLILAIYLYGAIVAVAHGFVFDSHKFVLGAIPLGLVSASIHFANEYADYDTDQLCSRTPFSGGSGAFLNYGIMRKTALQVAWFTVILGLGVAWGGVAGGVFSQRISLILSLGAFLGWMYSLAPLALSRRGWGELDNAFLGSILLPFYGYTTLRSEFDGEVLLLFLPFGFFAFNNLLAVMWADREADKVVGKNTLAV
jgi:1,4-dihydroxy-2-naphthoate octaprenyltransferase